MESIKENLSALNPTYVCHNIVILWNEIQNRFAKLIHIDKKLVTIHIENYRNESKWKKSWDETIKMEPRETIITENKSQLAGFSASVCERVYLSNKFASNTIDAY